MLIRRTLSLTLVAAYVSAQQEQRQNLPVNSINTFTVSSSSSDAGASFAFEKGSEQTTYYVSLSLCTDVTPYPEFYVSNGALSNITLKLDAGFATWNGTSPNGVLIYALPTTPTGTQNEWSFQLAVSTTGKRVSAFRLQPPLRNILRNTLRNTLRDISDYACCYLWFPPTAIDPPS